MSGLLDRIVRARRASADSRLGPPSENGAEYRNGRPDNGAPYVNGSAAPAVIYHALQLAAMQPATAPDVDVEHVTEPEPVIDPDGTVEFDVAQVDAEEAAADEETADEEAEDAEELIVEEQADAEEPEAEAKATTEVRVAEEPEAPYLPAPGFRERGRIRRRARYLRRLREVHLRDIGGFMVELHRFQRERTDLVAAKIDGAAQIDRELRALEKALGTEQAVRELREAGIGGACENCGAVHGSGDRFCASCGAPLQDPQE